MHNPLSTVPARTLVRGLAAAVGAMALVGIGGTAAAANGIFVPAAVSQGSSPSGSTAPSGALEPDRDGHDHDGRGHRHYRGDDGKDGDDGSDGKNGKNGRDGEDRTVYVNTYVTRYLNSGGNASQVHTGRQVAIYPSGGVDTGRP